MTDNYQDKKTKLVAVRMGGLQHAELKKMEEKWNEIRHWYGRITVSKLICMAVDDLISGKQEGRKKYLERLEEVKRKKKERR